MSNHNEKSPICHVLTVVDGLSEEVVDVLELEPFELAAFCHQFDVPIEHDPQMLDRYAVGPDDVPFLQKFMELELPFNFATHAYFIEGARKDRD